MDGVLIIDKPLGPTSHDVVAVVRRAIRGSRVGHTGTLDPLATGVLPLVVGRATRLAQFLSASEKEYIADVRIGVVSQTYDSEGPLAPGFPPEAAPGPFEFGFGVEFAAAAGGIEVVLAELRGTYSQMPPPHSAKKIGGTPAYKLTRRQKVADLKPVRVTVHALEALSVEADVLRLRVVCSAGFYVRTLAHEIGKRLGCGAYLAALRRTHAGSFSEGDAIPLGAVLAEGFDATAHLVPLNRLLPQLPAVVLNETGVRRVTHGNNVAPEHLQKGAASFPENEAPPCSRVRLMDPSGALLAIADRRAGGLLHPAIVLL